MWGFITQLENSTQPRNGTKTPAKPEFRFVARPKKRMQPCAGFSARPILSVGVNNSGHYPVQAYWVWEASGHFKFGLAVLLGTDIAGCQIAPWPFQLPHFVVSTRSATGVHRCGLGRFAGESCWMGVRRSTSTYQKPWFMAMRLRGFQALRTSWGRDSCRGHPNEQILPDAA